MGYIISFYVEMGLKYPKPALNSLFRTKDDCELPNTLSLPPGTLRKGIITDAVCCNPKHPEHASTHAQLPNSESLLNCTLVSIYILNLLAHFLELSHTPNSSQIFYLLPHNQRLFE